MRARKIATPIGAAADLLGQYLVLPMLDNAPLWLSDALWIAFWVLAFLTIYFWLFADDEKGGGQTINGDGNNQAGGNITVNHYGHSAKEPLHGPYDHKVIVEGMSRMVKEMAKTAPPPRNIYEHEKREKALKAMRDLDDKK